MSKINEYIDLKKKRKSLSINMRSLPEKSLRRTTYEKRINELTSIIKNLEMDEDVANYIHIINNRTRLKKQLCCWKRFNKDISKLEKNLDELNTQIAKLEKDDGEAYIVQPQQQIFQDPTSKKTSSEQIVSQVIIKEPIVTPPSEPTYYIINLAWTNIDLKIFNAMKEFICSSSYIGLEETSNMISWKYPYDTPEEQAIAKSLRMCAVHMLKSLKEIFEIQTDAEIFGKIQKF